MLAPGSVFDGAGSVNITAGPGTIPALINEGVGFMADGSIAVDTDAPVGSLYFQGIRQSAAGAFYGTTVTDPSDVYISGLRVSVLGQLVYEVAAPAAFNNGNPISAAGNLATA